MDILRQHAALLYGFVSSFVCACVSKKIGVCGLQCGCVPPYVSVVCSFDNTVGPTVWVHPPPLFVSILWVTLLVRAPYVSCATCNMEEEDLWWKTTFRGRRPLVEDDLWWAWLTSTTLRLYNRH